jgi:hypothetical protein
LFGGLIIDGLLFTIGGHKSSAPGIDLEFKNKGIYHLVSIKSGPNWGNSTQHANLAFDFINAERRLHQSSHINMVRKILGICYGKTKTISTKSGYFKIVGQNFWVLISENKNLYTDIVEPISGQIRECNHRFVEERDRITTMMTKSFIDEFCTSTGLIDWPKLIIANSGNYDLDKFFGEISDK